MGWLLALLLLGLLAATARALPALRRRGLTHWLAPAAAHGVRQFFVLRPRPVHVLFAVCDHFEPGRGGAPPEVADERLRRWLGRWPEVCAAHRDADGRPPQHTWFYPWDEWRDGELAALSALCYDGLGEIGLHLHHDGDTRDSLRAKLDAALAAFHACGALLAAGDPTVSGYPFIHGNWCLDNSRADGRWCGVNDELTVLAQTGCFADFTLPTPDATQPPLVNTVYRATDDPGRPRSHFRGRPLVAGRRVPGDLLLIPGPLGINLRDWHHRWYPAIEQSEIAAPSPVTPARVDFWVRAGVGVHGRPDWVFVKCHAHGCLERDQDDLLGEARHRLHRLLSERYDDGERYVLHYCTARELHNLALAAERGERGDPNASRDVGIAPPVNASLHSPTPLGVPVLSEARGEVVNRTGGAVDWRLRVGPVSAVTGAVRRLAWQGGQVAVEGDGPWRLTRRDGSVESC